MANGAVYNLALRVTADMQQAAAALPQLAGGIDDIRTAAAKANAALNSIDTSNLQSAATSLKQQAETADEAETRIRQMVQASLEYQRAMQAQIATEQAVADAARANAQVSADRAAEMERANRAAYESQAAITEQMRVIGELNDRIDRGASSLGELAETEQMIDRAMQALLVTEEEQLQMLTKLDKQEQQLISTQAREEAQVQRLLRAYDPSAAALRKLADDQARLKRAYDEGKISLDAYNRAMVQLAAQRTYWTDVSNGVEKASQSLNNLSLSARQVRNSLAAATAQLARGNVGTAGNTLLGLGTRGLAGFGALGVAIGGVTAALGLYAAAMYSGHQDTQVFERTLISTGNVVGATAGQLNSLRNVVGSQAGEFDKAHAALKALSGSSAITSDTLQAAAQGAVNLAILTGESIESTTAKIIALAKSPSEQLAALNDQYHFLTLTVYEHVKSLEAQGRAEDAARVAIEEFDRVHRVRVRDAADRAGELERSWIRVKTAVLGAWQAIKSVGRQDLEYEHQKNTERLRRLENERLRVDVGVQRLLPWQSRDAVLAQLDSEISKQKFLAELSTSALEREKQRVETAAETQRVQDEGVAAAARVGQILDRGKSKTEQLRDATKRLAEEYRSIREANPGSAMLAGVTFGADGSVSGGSYDRAARALQEKYKERGSRKKSDAERANDAARRELENLQKQVALLGELKEGETKVSEAARIRYEIRNGAYRNANATIQRELMDYAQLLDTERQRIEVGKQLAEVQRTIQQLQGNTVDPKIAETIAELQRLKRTLTDLGREDDVADVAKALNLIDANAQLQSLQKSYDRVMRKIEFESQRIQVELKAGFITEATAQERVVALYRDKSALLQEIVPQMRAMAEALGNDQALANIQQIELHLQEMAAATDLISQQFNTTFADATNNGIMALVTAAKSLKESIEGFFLAIAQGMAEFIARDWAQKLSNFATQKLLSSATDGATETANATTAANAAAPILAGGIASGSTTGAATLKSALDIAFSNGALKIAGAMKGADSATQMFDSMFSGLNSLGFASGGWTGPGGKYQPAGVVHAEEFVHRREVVRQPGALAFLTEFNRVGMAALHQWRGYASGGFVAPLPPAAIPIPRLPLSSGSGQASQVQLFHTSRFSLDFNSLTEQFRRTGIFEAEIRDFVERNPSYIKEQLS
ncbi:MAG: phage tail length tape measure family protein [Xanthomonadaceae bacterium]|jgi:phage-related minor tail protein|nr:phage tail length tape measure family protein [Xanthomonadaceae bacterium]